MLIIWFSGLARQPTLVLSLQLLQYSSLCIPIQYAQSTATSTAPQHLQHRNIYSTATSSLIPRPLIQRVYRLQYTESDPHWGWFGSGTETSMCQIKLSQMIAVERCSVQKLHSSSITLLQIFDLFFACSRVVIIFVMSPMYRILLKTFYCQAHQRKALNRGSILTKYICTYMVGHAQECHAECCYMPQVQAI